MSLFPVAVHMLGTPLPNPTVPPPLTVVVSSCRCPMYRTRWWGGGVLVSLMAQTCHRRGGIFGVGYFPPESLSYPARGSACSESGGLCVHWTLLQSVRSREGDPIYPGVWGGRGWGWPPTEGPGPYHYGPGVVPPSTLPPSLTCNMGILTTPSLYPGRNLPPKYSYLCTKPPID